VFRIPGIPLRGAPLSSLSLIESRRPACILRKHRTTGKNFSFLPLFYLFHTERPVGERKIQGLKARFDDIFQPYKKQLKKRNLKKERQEMQSPLLLLPSFSRMPLFAAQPSI
jgi:hypothetical protein